MTIKMVFNNLQGGDGEDYLGFIESEKRFLKESEATSRLLGKLRYWLHKDRIYKIPDIGSKQKPFDTMRCSSSDGGRTVAVEIKFLKNKMMTKEIAKEGTLKKLEPIQVLNLTKIKEAGGIALIIGYAEINKLFYIFKF